MSNSIDFELMHFRMLFVLDGAPLRRADGRLDRALLLRWAGWVSGSNPFYRQRMQRGVLGLTTPAWVADDRFDLAHHVLFTDGVVPFESDRMGDLSGRSDGPLAADRPLWRFRFTELEGGEVALGVTFHHGSFDGQGGMKLVSGMTSRDPGELPGTPGDPIAGQRPARAIELPLLAARQWLRAQPDVATAWREFRQVGLGRRIRRAGGRIRRPFRDRTGRDNIVHVPTRWSDARTLDAARVSRHASELGGTMSDLLAAATIRAYGGPERRVSLRYPVSPSAATPGRPRNQVVDLEISGAPSDEVAVLVPAIRAQVVAGAAGQEGAAHEIGFTTVLPWVSSPRYVAGAQIRQAIPFAVSQGRDEITVAAVMYNGGLHLGVTMQRQREVSGVTDLLCGLMTGELSDVPS